MALTTSLSFCGNEAATLPSSSSCSSSSAALVQIDRADGSAGDLATQMASGLNLCGGGGGGGGDPRAPVKL